MSKKSGKNLNLILVGGSGRMGQEIQELAKSLGDIKIVALPRKPEDWKKLKPESVDIVVDFSSAAGLTSALTWCLANKKPLVSGSTGEISATEIKRASAKIPILYSANMSLGIAALTSMLSTLGGLDDWEFQVEEAHHSKKKDSPSGTALLLQAKLTQITGKKLPPPNSIRGGGIAGIHQIWAMGPEESLVLQHTAFSRKVFAQGALKAARWLFDKKAPGLYDLSDLYKI